MATIVPSLIGRISSVKLVSGTVVALALSTSAAFAQCAAPVQTGVPLANQGLLVVPPTAAASAISGAIGNVNTAFLTQQGSAFVSAPSNPAPDQPGGGVWGRAIGGEVTLKTTSNSASTNTRNDTGAVVNNSTTNCANSVKASFAGVQDRGRHRAAELERLERPSRHDRRLSRLEVGRQLRFQQQV